MLIFTVEITVECVQFLAANCLSSEVLPANLLEFLRVGNRAEAGVAERIDTLHAYKLFLAEVESERLIHIDVGISTSVVCIIFRHMYVVCKLT